MVYIAIFLIFLAVLNYWMSYIVEKVLGHFAQAVSLFLSAIFLISGFATLMSIL